LRKMSAFRTFLTLDSLAISKGHNCSNSIFAKEYGSFSTKRYLNTDATQANRGNIPLSPAVRHLLAANHIGDTSAITGSGRRGRILKGDVLQFLVSDKRETSAFQTKTEPLVQVSRPKPATSAVPIKGVNSSSYQDIPQSELSKKMAQSYSESKSTIPHVYASIQLQIDDLLQLQHEINEKSLGIQVGLTEFFVRASAVALREVPQANATWIQNKIQLNPSIHISIALNTSKGVVTPTIRNVDSKGLVTLAQDLKDLTTRGNSGQLQVSDLEGGTFSVSNLDVDILTEVIKPPQTAIVAIGKGRKVVVPDDKGNLSIATVCEVTLSADQRVIDEELAGKFLTSFRKNITQI